MHRSTALRLPAALLAILLPIGAMASHSLAPGAIHEQVTGVRFDSTRVAGGQTFRCLGAGSRQILTFKIYAVAFCLQADRADAFLRDYAASNYPGKSGAALEKALRQDQGFFDALASVPGDKMAVLTFMRDIPHQKLSSAFRNSLVKLMPTDQADRVAQALERDVKQGETAVLISRGENLVLQLGGVERVLQDAPVIVKQLWRVWLGRESPTPNLKESIASQAAVGTSDT